MGIRDALEAIFNDIKSDVMKDGDSKAWQEAMNFGMESMYSNQVWELVDLLNGVKPI